MNALITTEPKPVIISPSASFTDFAKAWDYARYTVHQLHAAGHAVIAARRWQDRFKQFRPRGLQPQLLGWGKQAVNDCERLEPGGQWTVLVEKLDSGYQFELAYSRFLPYAHAMLQAEDGYKAFGLDFDSINSQFRTCQGFGWIGMGHYPDHHAGDAALYEELAYACNKIKPPQLPFDEVYRPCAAFVFIKRPDLFKRLRQPDQFTWQHVHEVYDFIGGEKIKQLLCPPAGATAATLSHP